MFRLRVQKRFWASHSLRVSGGRREQGHCHNWAVTAQVSRKELDESGMVIDFCRLEEMLESIISKFDNTLLDETEYFARNNPSAENVAKYIYEKIESQLPEKVSLDNITVSENPGCSATFERQASRKSENICF